MRTCWGRLGVVRCQRGSRLRVGSEENALGSSVDQEKSSAVEACAADPSKPLPRPVAIEIPDARVRTPLASAVNMVDQWHRVALESGGSYVENMAILGRLQVWVESGACAIDVQFDTGGNHHPRRPSRNSRLAR